MIRTEFYDYRYAPTQMNDAQIIVCKEVDDEGNLISKKIFTQSDENNFHERHVENANAIQKIIDNFWGIYHKSDNQEKLNVSKFLIAAYMNLDEMISNMEKRYE